VNQFLNLAKPCPAFAAVHAFELKRHLAAKKK
jgi:hypothetical protein